MRTEYLIDYFEGYFLGLTTLRHTIYEICEKESERFMCYVY